MSSFHAPMSLPTCPSKPTVPGYSLAMASHRRVAEEPLLGGRYRLKETLGSGGMAEVYRAEDTYCGGQTIAVKRLDPGLVREPIAERRFIHESRALRRIRNTHIVQGLGTAQRADDGALYFPMEYLEGETLRNLLQREIQLALDRVCDIALQICLALEEVHAADVVHRDVKPDNIFLLAHDRVKLIDFGVAKTRVEREMDILGSSPASDDLFETDVGTIVGTPRYMAPEQIRGDGVDGRADLYALGLIMYELLTGLAPISGSAKTVMGLRAAGTSIPPIREVNRFVEITPATEAFVLRVLENDPDRRFPTAREMHTELEAIKAGLPATPPDKQGEICTG